MGTQRLFPIGSGWPWGAQGVLYRVRGGGGDPRDILCRVRVALGTPGLFPIGSWGVREPRAIPYRVRVALGCMGGPL